MDKTELVNLLQNLKNSKMRGSVNPSATPLDPSGMAYNPSGQIFNTAKTASIVIPVIIIGFIGALVGNFFYGDILFPKSIRGQVVDLVYLPGEKDQNRLWIRTDDSFYYTQRTETGSSLSISSESLFNKTFDYIYDPVSKEIIYKNKTEYQKTPPKSQLYIYDGKVWEINREDGNNDASIYTYDPATGQKEMDTQAFINKWPQLKSGIAKLNILDKPDRLDITANDGQTGLYYLEENKMYKNATDYARTQEKQTGKMTTYALAGDDTRKELYRVTGPIAKLADTDIMASTIGNPESMKFFYDATAEPLTQDKVYLEGVIIFSDTDYILIIHQSGAGKDAKRLLTCIDSKGTTLWTLNQDRLLPEMGYSADDSFSAIFFVKDDFSGERANDIFLFKMRGAGLMGIDLPTGAVKWTFGL